MRTIGVALVAMVVSSGAVAAEDSKQTWSSPEEAFKDGRAAYRAKRYTAAVEAFEAAYAMDPDPRLAANLGEAYRQLGNCPKALEYLEVYLAAAGADRARASIERRAAKLREQCPPPSAPDEAPGSARLKDEASSSAAPAEKVTSPAPPKVEVPAAQTATPLETTTGAASPAVDTATVQASAAWTLGLEGGVALGRWGDARSTSPAVRVSGARTWWWGAFGLSVGAGLQWSTFAYASAQVAPEVFEKRAQALEVVGELQGRLQMLDWLVLRVDAGGGATWFSGFDAWNEISEDGAAAGAGMQPTIRGVLGLEVALPVDRLRARVTPIGVTYTAGPEGVLGQLSLVFSAGVGHGF